MPGQATPNALKKPIRGPSNGSASSRKKKMTRRRSFCSGLFYGIDRPEAKIKPDWDEAVKWTRESAGQGHVNAQLSLANSYYNGKIIKRDYAEAADWYRKAAEQGASAAQFNLGICRFTGRGVKQDNPETVSLFFKAARQGNAEAKRFLKDGCHKPQEPAVKFVPRFCEEITTILSL